jgi:hypothetical protein
MRDLVAVVDEEAVDVADQAVVGGEHEAGAADLDLAPRDPVVRDRDVRVDVQRHSRETGRLVVRLCEHGLDPDVPRGRSGRAARDGAGGAARRRGA